MRRSMAPRAAAVERADAPKNVRSMADVPRAEEPRARKKSGEVSQTAAGRRLDVRTDHLRRTS
jgi:hypothetical protein